MELDRKAFHFDLDNKSVERFYTGKKNPWSDIQDFLESHCFEKPQYSGYESAENIVMSYQRAYGTVDKMMDKFPWFHRCVKAATFTEIGESYDVKEFLENGLQLSLPLRPETRKELYFDLGTAALSENYSSIRPNAYGEIATKISLVQGFPSRRVGHRGRRAPRCPLLYQGFPWHHRSGSHPFAWT